MTLLDRLKPEFRKKLDEHELVFPIIVGTIKKEMIKGFSFTQIKVSSAIHLLHFCTNMPLSFENLESLFNEPKND